MFTISLHDNEMILNDHGIKSKAVSFAELRRYYYEYNNPDSKEVRLIVKVELDDRAENYSTEILSAFLKGYASERPFTDVHKRIFPYLYAIIDAFWSADIVLNENSLLNRLDKGDDKAVFGRLEEILRRLSKTGPMAL